MSTAADKSALLEARLRELPGATVAYSGGVDSALLAFLARRALGERMMAVLATGPSLAARERAEAAAFCRAHGIPLREVEGGEMERPGYRANKGDRCYHCRSAMYARIRELAEAEAAAAGRPAWPLLDGANADDLADYRPGRRAGAEAGVRSPFIEAGLTKADIRAVAALHGLSVADKPATPCLSSRIPHGQEVSEAKLAQVERAEEALRELGFSPCRVRHHGEVARVEVAPADFPRLIAERERVSRGLHAAGFAFVSLDLDGFRSGSLNETLKGGG